MPRMPRISKTTTNFQIQRRRRQQQQTTDDNRNMVSYEAALASRRLAQPKKKKQDQAKTRKTKQEINQIKTDQTETKLDKAKQIRTQQTLLCESAVLVKGKSFVILCTYFSFKELMQNPLVKEFSLLLKGICFID